METKREFRYYTIVEYDKEERYLQKRHGEGWRFLGITGIGMYHFEKCEPEGVVYQLDYNQEGISDRGEYIQMFADCGWEHVTDYVGYSYFRKSVSDMTAEEEIFNDDNSKLEMLQRIFKGRMIPLFIVFFLYLVLQFILPSVFEGTIVAAVIVWIRILLLIYLIVTGHFCIKYLALRRRVRK